MPLTRGREVLARWPDDGWYYFGRVDGVADGTTDGALNRAPVAATTDVYRVRDSVGHVATIRRDDLFGEEDKTFQAIQVCV